MNIRTVISSDYDKISPLIDVWWGGRKMSHLLPKLFFDHFHDTSLICERDGELVGFLIGFLSAAHQKEAYIHFVGVHPDYRKEGIGKMLYGHFFQKVKGSGRTIVRCITSPVNQGSISYHTNLGFEIVKGDKEQKGVSVHSNYDGPSQDRVLFVKRLDDKEEKGSCDDRTC